MRQKAWFLVAIFVSVASNATFAQVLRPGEPRLPAQHPTPTPSCNTGQAPAVRADAYATYAHLIWQPVPGAVEYHISRTSSGSPGKMAAILPGTNPLTLTEYTDAVPDPRYSYTYFVSAIRADRCYGTAQVTMSSTAFTLPNPDKAVVVRGFQTRGGDLRWSPVLGATAYRIDGPDFSVIASATPFEEGYPIQKYYNWKVMPFISTVKNPPWQMTPYIFAEKGTSDCWDCNIRMELKDIPNISRYSITAMFPGNWADYQHSRVVSPAIVPPCAITNLDKLVGHVGEPVSIHGVSLTYADQIHFIMDQRGDWFLQPDPMVNMRNDVVTVETSGFSPLQGTPPFMGVFGVHTPAGWCMSPWRYEVLPGPAVHSTPSPPPPPKVSVPDLPNGPNGPTLAPAQQILMQAGLKPKVIYGPSDPMSLVTSMAPQSGARVNPGSEVDLTTITSTVMTMAAGISTLVVINNLESHDDIYLWSFDNSTGVWNEENQSNALSFQGSTSITLATNHMMQFFAADPKLCPQLSDPADRSDARNSSCVAAFTPMVLGNSNGATTTWAIGQSMAY